MNDQLAHTRLEIRDLAEVKLFPAIAWDIRPRDDHRIEQYIGLEERRLRLHPPVASKGEKRQPIGAGDPHVGREQFRGGEQRGHVTVYMGRTNSQRDCAIDLRLDLELDFRW